MIRHGRGRFKFIKKHHETFNIDMLIPPAFVAGLSVFIFSGLLFLVYGLLSQVSDPLLVVFGLLSIVYSLYFLIIIAESLRISLRNGLIYFKYLPFIFFTVHFCLGYGFVKEFAQSLAGGSRSGVWILTMIGIF